MKLCEFPGKNLFSPRTWIDLFSESSNLINPPCVNLYFALMRGLSNFGAKRERERERERERDRQKERKRVCVSYYSV